MTTTDAIVIVVVGRPHVGTVIVHPPTPANTLSRDDQSMTTPSSLLFSKLSADAASAAAPARPPCSLATAPATFPAIIVVVKVIVIVIIADLRPLIC